MPQPTMRDIARRFRALSDFARLLIIEMIAHRERSVRELERFLDIEQSRLSFHLRVLKNAGLVVDRRHGRWKYYRINVATVEELIEFSHSLKPGKRPWTCTLACCQSL